MRKLIYLLCLTAFCSCTIQKRVYNKGYYVSWNTKYVGKDQADDQNKLEKTAATTEPGTEHAIQNESEVPNKPNPSELEPAKITNGETLGLSPSWKTSDAKSTPNDPKTSNIRSEASESSIEQAPLKTDDEQAEAQEEAKKVNQLAVLGFSFTLLALILGFLPASPITLLFFVLSLLLGLIFSFTAISQIKKGNGRGLALAVIGVVIGCLMILIPVLTWTTWN